MDVDVREAAGPSAAPVGALDEVLRRVRYLRPTWSFRSEFGYQNVMFLAAGQAVARTTGKSWDQLISERIFEPLGMRESSTSVRALVRPDRSASRPAPHPLQW